jgi:hypothetical protein
VVFEKHHSLQVKPSTKVILVAILSCADLSSDLLATHEIYLWEGLKIPDKTIELTGTRDLRGPPSLV